MGGAGKLAPVKHLGRIGPCPKTVLSTVDSNLLNCYALASYSSPVIFLTPKHVLSEIHVSNRRTAGWCLSSR